VVAICLILSMTMSGVGSIFHLLAVNVRTVIRFMKIHERVRLSMGHRAMAPTVRGSIEFLNVGAR
jgi:hypothetical protein